MEIEKKFKLKEIPNNIKIVDIKKIKQGYLGIGTDKSELRIRQIGNEHLLTYKTGTGYIREETEFSITKELFESLWKKTKGKRIHKKRMMVEWDVFIFEIDTFLYRKDRLILVEVEFKDSASGEAFLPPSWFGEEVTNDSKFKNQELAS